MTNIRLLGPAKERILSRLRDGRQTAREVASDLGIQTSAARKHLERLVEMGTVREEFVRGARGRPKKYYAITDAGAELFPRHYDVVLNEVLARLEADGGEESARRVITGVAENFARPVSSRPGRPRLARALRLLNDLGFEATAERRSRKLVITSRNCNTEDGGEASGTRLQRPSRRSHSPDTSCQAGRPREMDCRWRQRLHPYD